MTGWAWAALALYGAWLVAAFGVRTVIQRRRVSSRSPICARCTARHPLVSQGDLCGLGGEGVRGQEPVPRPGRLLGLRGPYEEEQPDP
jgi:hypothetical protein